MKCNSEEGRVCFNTLHKFEYNELMVVSEKRWANLRRGLQRDPDFILGFAEWALSLQGAQLDIYDPFRNPVWTWIVWSVRWCWLLDYNCVQFHKINAAQAGCIEALEDSSSDNLGGSNVLEEVVNSMGKGEEGRGDVRRGSWNRRQMGKRRGMSFIQVILCSHILFCWQTLSKTLCKFNGKG